MVYRQFMSCCKYFILSFYSAWVESIGTEEIALTWRKFDLCGVYKTIEIKKRGLEIDLWLKRLFNLRDSDLGRVNLLYIVFVSDPLASICLLKNHPLFLHFSYVYVLQWKWLPPPPPIGYEPMDLLRNSQVPRYKVRYVWSWNKLGHCPIFPRCWWFYRALHVFFRRRGMKVGHCFFSKPCKEIWDLQIFQEPLCVWA